MTICLKNSFLVSLLFLSITLNAQFIDGDNATMVSAQYPGGMEALYKFISGNLKYPLDAREKGIEGKVLLEFIIDELGNLKPETIKVLRGISASCNQEAIRVIKLCTTQWRPGYQNNKPIASTIRLAIIFKLTPDIEWPKEFNLLTEPFPAVVKQKRVEGSYPDWPLYGDTEMKKKIGSLYPGDSIQIDGWAPWLFHVTGEINGFVSFLSVAVPSEFSNLIQVIENESSNILKRKEKLDSMERAKWQALIDLAEDEKDKQKWESDNFELLQAPLVFLRLSSSKKEIVVGECTVVDLSLYVDSGNKVPFQFQKDFGILFAEVFKTRLQKENCWQASADIINIESILKTVEDRNFAVYTIYKAGYCPVEPQNLEFQPITIPFDSYRQAANGQDSNQLVFDKEIPFSTKPLTVKVSPLNNQRSTKSDFYNLVGKLKISESFGSDVILVGKPLKYSICLEGAGLTYPLVAPTLSHPYFSSAFLHRIHSDTIINSTYFSRSTFTYEIIFNQSGEIEIAQNVFAAFNPTTKEVYDLKTQSIAWVSNIGDNQVIHHSEHKAKANTIEIDISQSMQIEDYETNRLTFVKSGLIDFLSSRKKCDTELILFSGEAFQYNVSKPDSCYAKSLLDGINFKLCKGIGTAIGDAIWYAVQPLSWTQKPKKLVIIGDGENTSGVTSLTTAIKLAKARNVNIYTIGIGHAGPVKFGTDLNGNPNLIPQTFSDSDLKRIASQSGGKYFWADNKVNFLAALKYIFDLP